MAKLIIAELKFCIGQPNKFLAKRTRFAVIDDLPYLLVEDCRYLSTSATQCGFFLATLTLAHG